MIVKNVKTYDKDVKTHVKNNRELVLSLIKDDLLSTRLVLGLELLGLDSTQYYLHLSETIFSIMGIKDEGLYKKYIDESRAVMHIDVVKQPERLDRLVLRLYKMIEREAKR